MITIDNKFDIGDMVYLKTDKEQLPRIVFSFIITSKDILYEIASGTITSRHYDFELSTEVNVLLQTT